MPTAPQGDRPTGQRKKDWRHRAIEWLDAIGVAIFLAMLTRYYLVEPFKIPTGSMQPTLWGQRSSDRHREFWQSHYPERGPGGDKVLVSKLVYDLQKPRRWDIVVFKYPLDTSVNYIKRLCGLPGETIQIRDGDVWVDGELARKPPQVQNALWQRLYDQRLDRRKAATDAQLRDRLLETWHGSPAQTDRAEVAGGRLIVDADGAPDPIGLSYNGLVQDLSGNVIKDLCLDFDFETRSAAGALHLTLWRDDCHFRLIVPLDGSAATLTQGDQAVDVERPERSPRLDLSNGRTHHIEFSNADGMVRLLIDATPLLEHAYNIVPSDTLRNQGSSRAAFGVDRARVALWNLRLRHDVHYTDPRYFPSPFPGRVYGVNEPFAIPEGQYFFLGDNSGNSADSRLWGTVPERYLLGETFFIFCPLQRWRFVN